MKNLLLLFLSLLLCAAHSAAQSTIEFLGAAGTGGPAGIGPVTTAQLVTFHVSAATAFSPAITATYTLSNQQFTSIEGNATSPGTQFGGNITNAVNSPVPGSNIYDLMNALSGSVNANYTACNSCAAGTGVDVTANRSIELTNFSDALINAAGTQLQAYNARVQFVDMTITFNRPVSNPVLHVTGLGGQVSYRTTISGANTNYDLGFTTDIDLLTPGLSFSRLSGNTALTVTATAIRNNATRLGAATTPTALNGVIRSAASGSVVVVGTNITTISFRFFLRGDGGIVVDNLGNVVAANNGNIVRWGFHANFLPGGGGTTLLNGVSGDGFLFGMSLQQPVTVSGNVFNDINAGNVNNSTGVANLVPTGINANLVDANGKVVATTTVATDGTYSFPAIFEGNYTVSISNIAGTQGTDAPAANTPSGWGSTGEFNGTPNTGNDGTVNGTSATFTVAAANITNINFGIQRLPESAVNLQPGQGNPPGFGMIVVPPLSFQNSNVGINPNTQDYDGGTVTNIRITAFPSNANAITIGGTTYINGGTCPTGLSCTTWPAGGVTVPYTNGVGPDQQISVDPVDGNVNVVVPFVAVDNTGKEDATPGSITLPVNQPAVIGNRVWKDNDSDGVQDAGEVGVAGVVVTLYDNAGVAIATTITDAYGDYSFTNIYAASGGSTYSVGFTPPVNYTFSPQTPGGGAGNATDSDPNPATGRTAPFTVLPGAVENDIDAGLRFIQPPAPASIGDSVWSDADGDGVQDAGEPGVAGVVVTLYDGAGNVAGTTITDANGNYQFSNVSAGNYRVGFTLPAGFVFSGKDAGGDDAVDSDVNTSGINFGKTDLFTLAAGEVKTNVDAGLVASPSTASVGDRVWNDVNQDGRQDAGEPGIGGVTVQLYTTGPDGIAGNGDDVLVTTTVSDAYGNYMFTGISNGQYYVKFTPPVGYSISPANVGTNDYIDSDINAAGVTTAFYVTGGVPVDITWDAGMYPASVAGTASIGDKVWNDVNGHGIQDAGEPGVAGVAVVLYNSSGSPVDTVFTDINGNYRFVNLAAGNYTVGFNNLPTGFGFTGQDLGGNDNTDSDVNPSTGRTGTIAVAAGAAITNVDAGIRPGTPAGTATVGNRVWYDLNNNGIQEPGELGISGVTVTLRDAGSDGIFGNGDDVLRTTTTDALGNFIFTGLPAGNYRVEYSGLPAGFTTSPANAGGNDGLDSDGDALVGGVSTTSSFTLAVGEDRLDVALGLVPPANTNTISDKVWIDVNGDGVQNAGETNGLPGVTVKLYNAAGVVVATTVTDANGNYLFAGIPDGSYTVGFSNLPAGFSLTGKDAGADDALDSDADELSGRTGAIIVGAGNRNVTNVDAGATSTRAVLGDRVWNDLDGDGVQDAGEPGVAGVTVTLYDNTNTPVASTVTDASGNYLFANIIPGTYTVGFGTLPGALGYTTKEGVPSATGSDVNPITGRTDAITLTAGSYSTDVDAGVRPPRNSTIGDLVWNDANGNGIQDAGEAGIAGVMVTLFGPGADGIAGNGDDVAIGTAITNGTGNYLITNVPAGSNYYLSFTNKPTGTSFTTQGVGGAGAGNNSKVDATGTTSTFTVGYGQYISNLDAGIINAAILPVQLVSFAAAKSTGGVITNWQTANEIDMQYYEVQRSTTGSSFSTIGTTPSKGNGSYTYQFTDGLAGVTAKVLYYRLKMMGRDGSFTYSATVRLQWDAVKAGVVISPNPFGNIMNISIPAQANGKVVIRLLDAQGKLLQRMERAVLAGNNTVQLSGLQQLPAGSYVAEIWVDGARHSQQVVKQ